MEKVIRDGKVAVLYSPGYGAGWYSWHGIKELLFHPAIVELVEQGRKNEITADFCRELLSPKDDFYTYCGDFEDLAIEWIPEGKAFQITEYDGSETIVYAEDQTWFIA